MGSRSQLFVGRLPMDIREKDIEQVFEKYGKLIRCDVKFGTFSGRDRRGAGRTGMAYAFVDFDDRRDAEDAIRYENGREIRGHTIVVEWARGPAYRFRDNSYGSRGGSGGGGGGYRNSEECYRCHRTGHWARDCPEFDRDRYRPRRPRYSRSRSRSPRPRRRSPSGSRSPDRRRNRSVEMDRRGGGRRSLSRSQSPALSRSPDKDRRMDKRGGNKRSTSKSASRSRSRSPVGRGSRSPRNDDENQENGGDGSPQNDRNYDSGRSASRSP